MLSQATSTQVSCVIINPPLSPKDGVFMIPKCVGFIIVGHARWGTRAEWASSVSGAPPARFALPFARLTNAKK